MSSAGIIASMAADERRALDSWAGRLAALDAAALSEEHQVDAAMLANVIDLCRFEIDELREHTWNPLLERFVPKLLSGSRLGHRGTLRAARA